MNKEPRFRINAKQTSKSLWYFEATIEHNSDKISRSTTEVDVGDTITESLGARLWSMIEEAEHEARARGRKLVSDQ